MSWANILQDKWNLAVSTTYLLPQPPTPATHWNTNGPSNIIVYTVCPDLSVRNGNSKSNCLIVWTATIEPRHDKTNKVSVRPAKTQISLGIRPVWSESSLSAWRKLGSLATHWVQSEDCDQTGRIPRLIWVFAGRTLILLVLSCRSSIIFIYCIHKLFNV